MCVLDTRALGLAAILEGVVRGAQLIIMKRWRVDIIREAEKGFSEDFAISVPLMHTKCIV